MSTAAISGIPGQNLNVVDKDGNQAWTIAGRLPQRVGFDEQELQAVLPQDWSGGELDWNGYLAADEYPSVVNPEHGRLWTANARIVSGELLKKVGKADYALGARQQQIRNRLFALNEFNEQDFLNIALDDQAVFLARWQGLLLAVLENSDNAGNPILGELVPYVTEWEGRASQTSVGYLATKRFREQVINNTVGTVLRNIKDKHNYFWPYAVDNFLEYPVWALVTDQPSEHLPAGFTTWTGFLTTMAENVVSDMTEDGKPLSEQTWGKANTLAIKHPLSGSVPFLSRWLDMPAEPMPGDTYMPRVQHPRSGASERMVVAPGHEANGIFHMATGQSAHPLSPYFDAGHRDWVEGNPSAFLPGETKWKLELDPE